MPPHSKTFRAIVCSILAVLVFIHTTPLYAQDDGSSGASPQGSGVGQDVGLSAQGPTEVSSSGAAAYSVPIEVPKGRGGISPNLALTYNSYGGNGWIGVGWMLDMGSIERSIQTRGGMTYTTNDQFVATSNGSVSNLVARPDWGTNHYGNQIDGAFLNYSFNTTSGATGSWQVTDKNGTIYYYGSSAASQIQNSSFGTFKWLLDGVQDVNGNYMAVTYQNGPTDNQLYLHEIQYTGNGNQGPTNKVVFTLAPRTDTLVSYACYWPVTTASLLQTISVYANGQQPGQPFAQLVRTYQLNYANSTSTSRSLLQSVTQIGYDGTTLPSVTFQWRTNLPGVGSGWGPVTGAGHVFRVTDLNGDGLADVIYDSDNSASSAYFHVLLSTGNGFSADTKWGKRNCTYGSLYQSFQMADINGDGFPDLIYIDSNSYIHVLLNSGSVLSSDWSCDTHPVPAYSAPLTANTTFKLADVDGDGIPDLIYDSNKQFHVLISDGNGGFKSSFSAARAQDYYSAIPDFEVADMNGDGLADIVYYGNDNKIHVLLSTGSGFQPDTVWWRSALAYWNDDGQGQARPFLLADVNGDGLPDFVYNGTSDGADSEIRVLLNRGHINPVDLNGFANDSYWGVWGAETTPFLTDFTGGGLPDFAYTTGGGMGLPVPLDVMLNTKTGFAAWKTWATIPSGYYGVGDFNGDGISDFISEDTSGETFGVLPANGPVPDLIIGITNGIGGSYTINYTPSSASPNTNNQMLPFILQTVSSVSACDGNPSANGGKGNITTTNYAYSGGYYDKATKQFWGFSDVKQTLQDGTTVDSQYYTSENGGIFRGLMHDQFTTGGTDHITVNLSNTFVDSPSAAAAAAGSHFPCLITTAMTKNDANGTPDQSTTTTLAYDNNYGNLLTRNQVDNVTGSQRYDSISYMPDTAGKWLVSLPLQMSTMSSSGGAALSTTTFVYKPGTNLVLSKTFTLDGINDPVISYTYDSYGNVHTQTDPMENITTTAYDLATQTFPATITNAKNQYVTIYYDYRFGKPCQKIDANGNSTYYVYDPLGRLKSVTGPYSAKTYTYNIPNPVSIGPPNGQNVTVKALTGNNVWYTTATYFDGFGRKISTTSDGANGSTIEVDTIYDVNGRVWQKSYPYFVGQGAAGNIVYTYDSLGRVTQTAYPDGTSTSMAYSGGVTTIKDRRGNAARSLTRDGFGRLTTVTEYQNSGAGVSTIYQYDALGNLKYVTDPNGNTTGIIYDSLSRKIQMSDPSMGEWYYYYDANGNLTQQIDSKGQTIDFSYDQLNRLSGKQYEDANLTTVSYHYDEATSTNPIGRLTSVADNSGTTQFFYDEQGRTSGVLRTIDNTPPGYPSTYSTGFFYDPLNRITQITYPDSDAVNYKYDGAGNMSTVSNNAPVPVPYATFSGYNAFGQAGKIAYNNGMNTTLTYTQYNSRLYELKTTTQGSNTPLQDFVYGYDGNGNILTIADNTPSANNQTFSYDWLNRLATAQGPYGSINYNTDPAGNVQNPPNTANGNYSNGQTLVYDYDNRVTSIGSTSFVYDYQGARVQKNDGANNITTYVSRLYDINTTNGVTKHIFAGGRRIASITGTNISYYHPDHLGSLSIATNSSGSAVQQVTYLPYGEVNTNSYSGTDLPYKFTGHELDPETGLYYCGARYYDASQGRFLTPDTIVQSPGDPQTLNRYAYARNNPLAFIDPSGHGFFSFLEDFFAALFGAAITVLTMGAGIPVACACMLGGIVAGATDAAMHGGSLLAVVQGAFMGALGGLVAGAAFVGGVPWPVMAGAGAAIAGATGGAKGLESFAAGFAGSLAGGALGTYLNGGSAQDHDLDSGKDVSSSADRVKYQTYNPDPQTEPWEISFLQRIIFAEAGPDDGDDGLAAVAYVVRNRVDAPLGEGWDYDDTYQDAILRSQQFTAVGGRMWNLFANPDSMSPGDYAFYQQALSVGREVYYGQIPDPTGGATSFRTYNGGSIPSGKQVFGGNIFW
ncbi:MAG: toxin TcdB middle/N-terminal domain-containing protein [Syntrophobacteraceae bacterium]